jgi:adenylyltransferase/sulfurtransferase
MALSKDEIQRYSRHLLLPEVGMAGQEKLKAARVLLVGTGGLGSPAALYLAAAGVGTLGVVDADVVDESNLQRQVLHGQSTLGVKKVESARARLLDINPHIDVVAHDTFLSADNALALVRAYDIVADGTDNFPTRYLVNDACVLLGKPNVYASIFRFEGQLSVFWAERGPCYRCLYAEPPPPGLVPSCAEGGVLGILPGVLGVLQATEVIKLILGIGDPMIGRLLLFDALGTRFRELKLRKDPNCPLCGTHPSVTALIDYQQFCGIPKEPMATDIAPLDVRPGVLMLDVREMHEWEICRIAGAKHIPLGQLPARLGELDRNRETVVYCKMGGRSKKAIGLMQEAGFTQLLNLRGGINAWAQEVDPEMPRY